MDRFEQFLSETGDAAFAVDPRRRIVYWSPACTKLLGVSARLAMGQACSQVVCAFDGDGKRYCGTACTPGALAHGGAAQRPTPLWFDNGSGSRQQLWLSLLLVPSRCQGLWTVVHVLQRKPRDLATALADASECTHRAEARAAHPGLTPRERQILGLLAQGHCVAEISRKFSLSPVTVRNHVQHMVGKLGVHSQLEAVAYAYRNNLV